MVGILRRKQLILKVSTTSQGSWHLTEESKVPYNFEQLYGWTCRRDFFFNGKTVSDYKRALYFVLRSSNVLHRQLGTTNGFMKE